MTVESNYDTFMAISQSGEGNSQHGTRWIFSIDEKRSTKIGKEVSVPDGWYVGRVLDFTGMECFEDVAIVQRERKLALSTSRRERSMDDIRRVNSAEARRLYGEFTGGEYASMREFCKDSDYDKSVVALSKLWKRYIPEFTPIQRTPSPVRSGECRLSVIRRPRGFQLAVVLFSAKSSRTIR